MVKEIIKGSGITARRLTKFSGEELAEAVRFFKENQKKRPLSFPEKLVEVEAYCIAKLKKANLPTSKLLQMSSGQWVPREEPFQPGVLYAHRTHVIVEVMGIEHDSPAGFATRSLDMVADLRKAMAAGNVVSTAEAAYRLGELGEQWWLKKFADSGVKTKAAGKRNIARANDPKRDAAERYWSSVLEKAEALRRKYPAMKRREAVKRLQDEHGIKRHRDRISERIKDLFPE
jgi:hypothetical protein